MAPDSVASSKGMGEASPLDHGSIRAIHFSLPQIGQGGVDFKRGDAIESRTQEICCETRPWTHLQQILFQIQVPERPRQHFVLKELSPETGPTNPSVQTIHDPAP